MSTFSRIASCILGVGIVCLVSVAFSWQHGTSGFWVSVYATIAALLTTQISQHLLRKVMVGVASIVGGAIGAIVGARVFGFNVRMEAPVVFTGAVLGGAIWVIGIAVSPFNKERLLRMSEEPPEHATARKERASEYLFFSLGSIAIGLIAGLIFFVIYYVGVGIEPSDQSYVFGYAVRGGDWLSAVSR